MNFENEVMVSIICNTYNHEKYISKAIESFLSQKTNFCYEVLIHDDASTDGSVSIIEDYHRRYPNIIKPIFQSENQYSKGVSIFFNYQLPRAKGKYIAICEGDDYWIDENKLQTQYDILEKNENINLCCHKVLKENGLGKIVGEISPSKKNKIIKIEEVIEGGGGFVGTCSLFIRKCTMQSEFFINYSFAADYVLQVFSSYPNELYYINEPMSVYRVFTENSWTVKARKDISIANSFTNKSIEFLEIFNDFTHQKYNVTIHNKTNYLKFLVIDRIFLKIKKERKEAYRKMTFSKKMMMFIRFLLRRR